MSADENRAWLQELLANRRELQRMLFAVDASSATISAGGGSQSYTNRSVAELKQKLAAVEAEILAVCGELGEPPPFTPAGGVKTVKVRFC